MKIEDAIQNPNVNAFDIIRLPNGKVDVFTYAKPGESLTDYEIRNRKNLDKAKRLTQKSQD